MNTCRFCKKQHDSLVQYSRRHYACWDCYLDAGKPLTELSTNELRRIPWRIVRDRNLEGTVCGILAGREKRVNDYIASLAQADRDAGIE